MSPVVVIVVILLIVLLSVGGYLLYRNSPSRCSSNASVLTWKIDANGNCVATVCASGYGIDAAGTPASDGTCPVYKCTNKEDPNAMTWNTDCSISTCKSGFTLSEGSCVSDYSQWAVLKDTDYPSSGLIKSFVTDSPESCMSNCATDSSCLLTVFKTTDPNKNTCWLKKADLKESKSAPGYNVYQKPSN